MKNIHYYTRIEQFTVRLRLRNDDVSIFVMIALVAVIEYLVR
jgi:hypothetical protein